jgi:hypothetical protein
MNVAEAKTPGVGWIYTYLAIQFLCQLLLLVPSFGGARVVFRGASFGASLMLLFLVRGKPLYANLVRGVMVSVLLVLTVSWMNPEGEGLIGASAHWLFQLSIMAPLFWVARLHVGPQGLQRVVLILWGFYAASAATGVLQATYPGRFQPPVSIIYTERGKAQLDALSIQLSSGDWIIRPMGLTDLPAGAGYGGFYAVLLGVGVFLIRPFAGARIAAIATMLGGAVAVYLCQTRALVIMLGVCLIALIVISALTGKMSRTLAIVSMVFVVGSIGFVRAVSLGGQSVTGRLASLVANDAGTVYYTNRGMFMEYTFTELLPQHPLGAGLGRWGMMNHYFGDPRRSFWVEVQWTGWLYDGGILLMLLYPLALCITTYTAARIAFLVRDTAVSTWATIIFAYDVGALALSFSYPNFAATVGIEFWLINALLLQTAGSLGLIPALRSARSSPVTRRAIA